MSRSFRIVLRALGIGALVAGGLAIAFVALLAVLLIGPLIFWLAWNVLDFAAAVGLPELGFWGIVPDEIDGGHCVALSRPKELAERLDSYYRSRDVLGS